MLTDRFLDRPIKKRRSNWRKVILFALAALISGFLLAMIADCQSVIVAKGGISGTLGGR